MWLPPTRLNPGGCQSDGTPTASLFYSLWHLCFAVSCPEPCTLWDDLSSQIDACYPVSLQVSFLVPVQAKMTKSLITRIKKCSFWSGYSLFYKYYRSRYNLTCWLCVCMCVWEQESRSMADGQEYPVNRNSWICFAVASVCKMCPQLSFVLTRSKTWTWCLKDAEFVLKCSFA